MLICPLCGKSTSLRYFDPSDYDEDIYIQTVRGLGRGMGFEVTDKQSAIGDSEITRMIGERVLVILSLLYNQGILRKREIVSALYIKPVNNRKEIQRLERKAKSISIKLEESYADRNYWKSQTEKLQHDNRVLKNEIEVLEVKLEECEEVKEESKSIIRKLENEAEAFEAGVEEEEGEIQDVIESIEDCLSTDDVDWDWKWDEEEYPVESLKERVNALINEYEAFSSEIE